MERKRFKIGQHVRFRTREEMKQHFGDEEACWFVSGMDYLCGTDARIVGYDEYINELKCYKVELGCVTPDKYGRLTDWSYNENMLTLADDEQDDDDEPMNFGEAIDKIGETFARVCKEAGIDSMSIDYHKGRWFCSDANGELFAGGKVKD